MLSKRVYLMFLYRYFNGYHVYFLLSCWNLLFHFLFSLSPQAAASIKDGKRILFQFNRAAFSLKFLPFKVPYPVPFRLLGDEAKGWLDTTYLSRSGNLRISRGNKVTKQLIFLHVCVYATSKSCSNSFKYVMCQGLRTTSYVAVVQGTTFVLQKNNEPRQILLEAISKDKGVIEVRFPFNSTRL